MLHGLISSQLKATALKAFTFKARHSTKLSIFTKSCCNPQAKCAIS